MKRPTPLLCPIERSYYEVLLQPHVPCTKDPLRPVKLEILTEVLRTHQCKCCGTHRS